MMIDKMQLIEEIQAVFGQNEYPGDDYLIGSSEGSEPREEIQPFIGQTEWTDVSLGILDNHSGSLNFFSEAGYRFFLPAYLVADLNEQLVIADPVFTLTHGFSNLSVPHEIGGKSFVRKTGKDVFINPKRYGALTFEDYSRYRLSIFTREEAGAIVKYLEYKQDSEPDSLDQDRINAALNTFWYERQKSAPTAQVISDHLRAEEEYLAMLFEMGE
jgi:hypothetical protein